ncbi:2TM domain-containing protein [Flavobacterium sp. JLP]|uniref:2TM domain-containing protein n=1 Tax=unclassified Flavobacterium TaxID=196869 RepID=UPI0004930663|nr:MULTISPECIES: 2TM domain-containing protein [unclassified Flavobacterium]MBF4494026.1 2TM domain-containing protein [Flavobacterium sp. MR2016-29]MBF4506704.1 2TM domain-containing protein [Flavobacterium sp. JLP]
MEKEVHEQYEYARRRIRQKKILYFHFVLFLLGSLFLFVGNRFFGLGASTTTNQNWCIWAITIWFFLFILHFIKVYITDRFMNKKWEREQIDRLVALQQKRISQLESRINEDTEHKI